MHLYSYSLEELKSYFKENNEKAFRADQVFDWLYQKRANSFDEMKNLNPDLKALLKEKFKIQALKLVQKLESEDKETFKFLWQLHDGNFIESVLINSKDRRTVCVSSQIGCKRACLFCASGKKGFVRNLSAGEIVEQVVAIDNFLKEKDERVSNVVFMGMGEPLDNYQNVLKAIKIINEPKALNISQRKITISTVGITDKILQMLDEDLKVNLTLSLHAPNQQIRSKIMPAAKHYPLDELLKVMGAYFDKSGRDVTFEYILISGVNDQKESAEELKKKIKSHFNVNLIPYNPVEGVSLKRPEKETVLEFKEILSEGVKVTIRYTKGKDIAAACGQLAFNSKSEI